MNLFIMVTLAGILFFLITIFTWIIFGSLIMLQIKRWTLASKGYVEIEHISATKVRNYFIMKPKDNKFDFDNGFYHFIPETITRKGDLIKKYDKNLLNKDIEFSEEEFEGMNDKEKEDYKKKRLAELQEIKNLVKVISDRKYDPELLNRKMGMPVITYYADNPDPMNHSDRNKVYGSGVIKDMYLRLLLTQRYKDFRMFIIIALICFGLIAVANMGFYYNGKTLITNNANCLKQLDTCRVTCDAWVNSTLQAVNQKVTGAIVV